MMQQGRIAIALERMNVLEREQLNASNLEHANTIVTKAITGLE
jgi:hypothetical protein